MSSISILIDLSLVSIDRSIDERSIVSIDRAAQSQVGSTRAATQRRVMGRGGEVQKVHTPQKNAQERVRNMPGSFHKIQPN
jgi:hypothetical protein